MCENVSQNKEDQNKTKLHTNTVKNSRGKAIIQPIQFGLHYLMSNSNTNVNFNLIQYDSNSEIRVGLEPHRIEFIDLHLEKKQKQKKNHTI